MERWAMKGVDKYWDKDVDEYEPYGRCRRNAQVPAARAASTADTAVPSIGRGVDSWFSIAAYRGRRETVETGEAMAMLRKDDE